MGCNLGRNLGARGYSLSLYHPLTGAGDQQVVGNAIQQYKELQDALTTYHLYVTRAWPPGR